MVKVLRRLLIIVPLIVAVSMVTQCAGTPVSQPTQQGAQPTQAAAPAEKPAEPIRIGVITSLTGTNAVVGQGCKNGIDLTVKDLNAEGGVLGRQVEILYEDDTSTTSGGVNAFNKLVQEDGVHAVLGPLYSTICLAIKPRAEEVGIPFMGLGLNDRIGTEDNPKWTFQGRTSDALTPYFGVDFIVDKLGAKKPAILYVADDYGIDGKNALIEAFEQKGLSVVSEQASQLGDKDFTAQIENFKASGADGIVAWMHAAEAGLVLRQMSELGLDITEVPFVGNSSFLGAGVMDVAGDGAIGEYALTATEPTFQNPEWSAKFKAAYDYDPDYVAADPSDALVTLLRGVELGGGTNPGSIRRGLLSIHDWKGLFELHCFGRRETPQQGMFACTIVTINEDKQAEVVDVLHR